MTDSISIQFGSKKIECDLAYQDRKTLGISVHPDRSVSIFAPIGTHLDEISKKIRKRAPWILKQQSYFLTFEPRTPARKYISGETHWYLGRQYRLKIIESDRNTVKMDRGYIKVYTYDKSSTKKMVDQWYYDHAVNKFDALASPWIERFKKYNVSPRVIITKKMNRRWGSCTPTGKIILNVDLIKASRHCIEYVILHELCHLIHHNHSKAFFELQSREMPDWKRWKELLESRFA